MAKWKVDSAVARVSSRGGRFGPWFDRCRSGSGRGRGSGPSRQRDHWEFKPPNPAHPGGLFINNKVGSEAGCPWGRPTDLRASSLTSSPALWTLRNWVDDSGKFILRVAARARPAG